MDRISASEAGVLAILNTEGQRANLTASHTSSPLELDSGMTGFFSALNIVDGLYAPTPGRRRARQALAQRQQHQLIFSIQEMATRLNTLVEKGALGRQEPEPIQQLRSAIRGGIVNSLKRQGLQPRTPYGLTFTPKEASPRFLTLYRSNQRVLANTLRDRREAEQLQQFLFGRDSTSSDGLISQLLAITDQAEAQWRTQLNIQDSIIDRRL